MVEPRFFTVNDMNKPITESEHRDDLAGYSYAFGRMDAGDPPVVGQASAEVQPSATSTAWLFGSMWMQLQREYREPDTGGYFPGIQPAWDNFVASGGRTLRRMY